MTDKVPQGDRGDGAGPPASRHRRRPDAPLHGRRSAGTVHRALTLEDGTLAVTGNYLKVRIPPGRGRNRVGDGQVGRDRTPPWLAPSSTDPQWNASGGELLGRRPLGPSTIS